LKWRTDAHIRNETNVGEKHGLIREVKAAEDGRHVAVLMEDGEVLIYRTNDGKLLNSNSIKGSFMEWEWGLIGFSRDSNHMFVCIENGEETNL
jgi:hypothetical protein